jgi:membrane protein implicated in regulation of membrane protease activity
MANWLWLSIGVLCIVIEIFTPGFYFFSIGIGAIITGLIPTDYIILQIIIFAASTAISFFLMQNLSKKIIKNENKDSNIYALIGKTAIVTKEISADHKGYVKIESEEWAAVTTFEGKLPKGSKVEIIKIEGNKVFVDPINNKGE